MKWTINVTTGHWFWRTTRRYQGEGTVWFDGDGFIANNSVAFELAAFSRFLQKHGYPRDFQNRYHLQIGFLRITRNF